MKKLLFHVRDEHRNPIATVGVMMHNRTEILIVLAVCNPKDMYSKDRAREIINGRLYRVVNGRTKGLGHYRYVGLDAREPSIIMGHEMRQLVIKQYLDSDITGYTLGETDKEEYREFRGYEWLKNLFVDSGYGALYTRKVPQFNGTRWMDFIASFFEMKVKRKKKQLSVEAMVAAIDPDEVVEVVYDT